MTLPALLRRALRRPRVYRTPSGRALTDADIEALADEAERGYDVEKLGPPRGAAAPIEVVPVRMQRDLHDAVKAAAHSERTSVSEIVRAALRSYLEPAA